MREASMRSKWELREEGQTDGWPPRRPVLLFDGVCHLCQRSVKFVLRHERDDELLFCPLQSPAGRDLLSRHGLSSEYLQTMMVVSEGVARTGADAILEIGRRLRAPWSWVRAGRALPKSWRDTVYGFIASRRYRWFGKDEDFCVIPDESLRTRLLQDLPEGV